MACAAVRSGVVVLLLLACCLIFWSHCGSLWLFYVLLCVGLCPFWFCGRLLGEGGGGLVALLGLSSWCLVVVVWLFLAVPWVCLQFLIMVFPDHTHYFRLYDGSDLKTYLLLRWQGPDALAIVRLTGFTCWISFAPVFSFIYS